MGGEGIASGEQPDLSREGFALFDRLLDLEPAEQARALDELARTRPELHRSVSALLAAAEGARSSRFLTGPRLRPEGDAITEECFRPGDGIGPYCLERLLGRGGMGEVWLAHRSDGAYATGVALKLLHGHMAAGAARERFVREGRILGSLSHPNIARLLDAGITAQGQQYLVIEHVDGQRIDRWCDEARLGIEARIRLFLEVCAAVAYAHSHLVVHRDLKPSNILIAADGRVKLLDFGIAKLIEPERSEAEVTELTRSGGGAMTPEYAAPEQVLGAPVTTATDVHSLGLLLYRLLAGRQPFESGSRTPAQLAFDVVQTDPRALSEAVLRATAGGASPAEVAALRGATPRTLSRMLRGDLDAIVGKALRKEPEARYPDARALAGDLERYLGHEPVRARTGARAYVWRRFMRRHWLPLSVLAAFVVTLLAGTGMVLWQARQTQREARRAAAVTDFLIRMFDASDPRIAQDAPRSQITARELLDRSADRIATDFAADPATEIRLLGVAADIYRELDDHERYRALHGEQMQLARRFYGDLHPVVIEGLLGDILEAEDRNDYSGALQLAAAADPQIHAAGMDDSALRARWWLLRGEALTVDASRWNERADDLGKAVDLYRRVAPTDPGYVKALTALGELDYDRGDYPDSEQHYLAAIAAARQASPRNDAELLEIHEYLALAYHYSGELDKADATYRDATAIALRTYGDHHRHYWRVVSDHARLVHERGDRERALRMFGDLMKLMPPEVTPNGDVAEVRYNYAASLVEEGRPAAAIPLLEAIAAFYRERPNESYSEQRVQVILGDACDMVGRVGEARALLTAALDNYSAAQPPDSDVLLELRERWGRFLLGQGDAQGAEAQFAEVIAQTRNRVMDATVLAWRDRALLALARHDIAAAATAERNAVQGLDRITGLVDARTPPALWEAQARVLLASGELKPAHDWAQRALDADRRLDGEGSVYVDSAEATLKAVEAAQAAAAAPAATT